MQQFHSCNLLKLRRIKNFFCGEKTKKSDNDGIAIIDEENGKKNFSEDKNKQQDNNNETRNNYSGAATAKSFSFFL